MGRLAEFEWRSPPPASVDEQLVIYDDKSAFLVVRRPRQSTATIGTFRCQLNEGDLSTLTKAGPAPVRFDLLAPPRDPGAVTLMAAADRVAAGGRATPEAAAEFFARPLGGVHDGVLPASILVVAAGTRPVELELDVPSSAVHFSGDGHVLTWSELPNLATGFVTTDAEGLGGLRRPAHIEAGAFGAIAFDVSAPAGATAFSVQVAGWLNHVLPDAPGPERFEARTAEALVHTAS